MSIEEKVEEIAEGLLNLGMLFGAPDKTSAGVFKRQATKLILENVADEVEGMDLIEYTLVDSVGEKHNVLTIGGAFKLGAQAQIKAIADHFRAKGAGG